MAKKSYHMVIWYALTFHMYQILYHVVCQEPWHNTNKCKRELKLSVDKWNQNGRQSTSSECVV